MIINLLTFCWDHKDLFDDYKLPTQVDKQDYIDRMLLEVGELELYITSPNVLKYMIGAWSRGRLPEWQRIADIRDLEYNPIWNVDGTVTHTETTTGTQDSEDNTNRTSNIDSERDINRDNDVTETNTTTNTISADNSSNWSNDTKTDYSGTRSETETTTDAYEESSGETIKNTGSVEHQTMNTWEDRRTGNIGVTMTQQMMTAEKDFWTNFDLYEILIKDFKQEFCLLVY